jgi:hypothetical protein
MPTFKLENEEGQWLADARLGAHDWKPGDRIPRGRDTLEVIAVRGGSDDDEFVTLIVRAGKDTAETSDLLPGSSYPP